MAVHSVLCYKWPMTDTLTIALPPEAAAQLRQAASAQGETAEALAQRLLEEAVSGLGGVQGSQLSPEQVADLARRVAQPTRVLSKAESDAFFERLLAAKGA